MSHYVMVTNKLYQDDRTDEYIILCKFGSHNITGYTVTGVEPPKAPGLNRVKYENISYFYFVS